MLVFKRELCEKYCIRINGYGCDECKIQGCGSWCDEVEGQRVVYDEDKGFVIDCKNRFLAEREWCEEV